MSSTDFGTNMGLHHLIRQDAIYRRLSYLRSPVHMTGPCTFKVNGLP